MSPDPLYTLRDALDAAPEMPRMALPGEEPGDGGGQDDVYQLPPDCPVVPLGYSSDLQGNQVCYYLDSNGVIHGLGANNKHGAGGLAAMFGRKGLWFLLREFGKWTAPKKERNKETNEWEPIPGTSRLDGFKVDKARDALINACHEKGFFNPAGKLRGRGAHRSDNGHLVLHLGDRMLLPKERATGRMDGMVWGKPAVHAGYVYPAGEACLMPWHEAVGDDVAIRTLSMLRTWSWKRPLIDPIFILGQLGVSYLGGWINWRPVVWIAGNRGTGKSTLDGTPSQTEGLIGHLLGKGVFNSSDPSAASIRRGLNNATIPVILDELEASANNDRVNAIVELARIAAGGGSSSRVGQDMNVEQFKLQSPFWFSSILMPPIPAQDRSRMAICELKPLSGDLTEPNYFKAWGSKAMPIKEPASQIGAKLFRRMIDACPSLDQVVDWFRQSLKAQGHDSRAANVFGTLLGCAWVLLHDDVPTDEDRDEYEGRAGPWLNAVRPSALIEVSGATSEETACLGHLLTSIVQGRGGDEREPLAEWVSRAVSSPLLAESTDRSGDRIMQFGLKLVNAVRHADEIGPDGALIRKARWGAVQYLPGHPGFLAIANSHKGLDELFRGTKYAGGVWSQVMGRVEGALEGVKVRFGNGGASLNLTATLVPLSAIFTDPEGLPEESKPEAFAAWMAAQVGGVA